MQVKLSLSDIEILDGDRGVNYPKKEEFTQEGYCLFLDASNVTKDGFSFEKKQFISEERDEKLRGGKLRRGDIVLTTRGTIGNFAYYSDKVSYENMRINSGMLILRNGTEFDSQYLYQLLKSSYIGSQIKNITTGSSQPQLTRAIVKELTLLKPSLINQQRIAAVLSSLDEKIELNRKINKELEQIVSTLYDYWFVQFDFPDVDGKPYRSSGNQMIYSNQLKREIPEGWKIQDMYSNDLFSIIKPKIDRFTGKKRYIATADIDNLNTTNGSLVTYENRESRANMQPKDYTVWFAKMKSSVKHILVGDYSKDLLQNTIFSTGFMGLQASKETFEYVALTIHRPYFELVKDANANGATMAAIGNNDMKNIKLVVPSSDVITSFHEVTRPILEKMDQNRQQSQKLAELRDWLLPMLINGQVRVDTSDSSHPVDQAAHEPSFLAP